MGNKPFNRALYNQNDSKARAAGKRYWLSLGYKVIDNPDTYGADLIIDTGTEKFYSEVEIKRVWSGKDFAYDTLQIPERKKKFLNLDMPTKFIVFNAEQTHGFVCPSNELAVSPLVEVPNKYMYSGERFFQVPVSKISLVEVPGEEATEQAAV